MACGNAGSWTHWARPGIEPATSWFLVRFISAKPRWELPLNPSFHMKWSRCTNTLCWKDHPFLIELHWHLCQKLVNFICKSLFLDFQFYLLIFISKLLSVLYLLDYYSFIEVLNSGSISFLAMFVFFKTLWLEFPLWCSRNESDWEPWGCGFDPWPHSVGYGSGVAVSVV